jgi:hypothetical protein
MGLAPTLPGLQTPLLARTLNDSGRPSPAWTGFFQDIADRLGAVGKGVTDGSDAQPGNVGEYMTATGGPVALFSGSVANVVSLDLTAGDWDVTGNVQFSAGAGTHTFFGAGVTTIDTLTAATFPTTALAQAISPATRRVNVTATTTTWLVAEASFTGTVTATGTIRARRMR